MDLSWLLACVVGTGTALVELLSRYRDEPFKVIAQTQFAWVYLALNGLLALGAHWVLIESPWGGKDSEQIDLAVLAMISGLGSAVILRSRVFTAQLGDEQISIGPGYVVDQLLSIIDAQIDRRRALERVRLVVKLMTRKDFEKAKTYASTMITGSRQNLSLQEQKDLAAQIREVQDRRISDQEKAYALGFILLDFMGEDFLQEIARGLPQLESQTQGGAFHESAIHSTATFSTQGLESVAGTGEVSDVIPIPTSPLSEGEGVPARRGDWSQSRPVQRAKIVMELLTNVPLEKVHQRVVELIDTGALGANPSERTALRLQVAEILSRSGDTPQDKAYALGFAALGASDHEFFRRAFSPLASEAVTTASEIPERRPPATVTAHRSAAHSSGEANLPRAKPTAVE